MKKTTLVVTFRLVAFFVISFVFNALAVENRCGARLFSHKDLSDKSTSRLERSHKEAYPSEEHTPTLLQAGLPDGARFLSKPLRKASSHRYYRPLSVGKGYAGINVPVKLDDKELRTNVGVSPQALVENIGRRAKNKPTSLVSSSARAVVVWLHGGGTNLSSWQNSATAASSLASQNIEVISLDFFGHGEGPQEFYKNPEKYIEYVLEFMNQYVAAADIPVILAGHSMGGMIADITSMLYPKSRLKREYPKLRLSGVAMLSPPADPTPGEDFSKRFAHQNTEREEDETTNSLTEVDNINLPSQQHLLALDFLHRWSRDIVTQSDDCLPLFFAMGTGDDLWKGKEHLFEEFVAKRKNLKAKHYHLYSKGVDHHNNEKVPEHIIPAIFSHERPQLSKQGGDALKDPRYKYPIVFVDLVNFIEEEILINEPQKNKAKHNSIVDSYSRFFDLWSSSSFFRSFVEVYSKATRKTAQPEVVLELKSAAEDISSFGKHYFLNFSEAVEPDNKKSPRRDSQNFTLLKKEIVEWSGQSIEASDELKTWYNELGPDVQNSFVFDYFSNLERPSNRSQITLNHNYPANLQTIKDLLLAKNNVAIVSALKDEAMRANEIINGEFTNSLSKEQSRLRNEARQKLETHSNQRSQQLKSLYTLNSRKIQLARIFSEFTMKEIAQREEELLEGEEWTVRLTNLQNSLEKFKETRPSDAEELLALTRSLEPLKNTVYSSYMGADLRVFLSGAFSMIKEIETPLKKGAKKTKEEELKSQLPALVAFLKNFSHLGLEILQQIRTTGSSAKDFSRLNAADRAVDEKRRLVYTAQEKFFEYHSQLISEWIANKTFATEEQPPYPSHYEALIEEYQKAQDDFQESKNSRKIIFFEEARKNALGPLIHFLVANLDTVAQEIDILENELLHETEIAIQEQQHYLQDLQTELDEKYSQNLFYSESISSLDFLNRAAQWPLEASHIQDILGAWRMVSREVPEEDDGQSAAY